MADADKVDSTRRRVLGNLPPQVMSSEAPGSGLSPGVVRLELDCSDLTLRHLLRDRDKDIMCVFNTDVRLGVR